MKPFKARKILTFVIGVVMGFLFMELSFADSKRECTIVRPLPVYNKVVRILPEKRYTRVVLLAGAQPTPQLQLRPLIGVSVSRDLEAGYIVDAAILSNKTLMMGIGVSF